MNYIITTQTLRQYFDCWKLLDDLDLPFKCQIGEEECYYFDISPLIHPIGNIDFGNKEVLTLEEFKEMIRNNLLNPEPKYTPLTAALVKLSDAGHITGIEVVEDEEKGAAEVLLDFDGAELRLGVKEGKIILL